MYNKEIQYYAFWVYQNLCGKNGWFLQSDIKANVREDERFDLTDRVYYQHMSKQDFVQPNSLRLMEGKRLEKFNLELKKNYRKKSSNLKRLQFDTVKILKNLEKQGFGIIDVVNYWRDDIIYRKKFQILLRNGNVFLLIEDDFTDRGSTLKLFGGIWTAMSLSATKDKSLKLVYSIPHRQENKSNYLVRIADAANVFFKSSK
jgi:hypothetical protein